MQFTQKPWRKLITVCAIFFPSSIFFLLAWLSLTPATDNLAASPEACRAEIAQIDSLFTTNKPTADCDIRQRYLNITMQLMAKNAEWEQRSLPIDIRSQCAFAWRHHARLVARSTMSNQWEVGLLRLRDIVKYRDPDGPTFSALLKQQQKKGNANDAAYKKIIESAEKTDGDVNQSCQK